jgi:hypothetical protein
MATFVATTNPQALTAEPDSSPQITMTEMLTASAQFATAFPHPEKQPKYE